MVANEKMVKPEPCTPIFQEQRNQNTDQQQAIAHQVEGKLREEGRQLGHIAVDALDQFAGRMIIMETHIQVEGMPGKLGTQSIGGRPGDILAEIRHTDGNHLLQ